MTPTAEALGILEAAGEELTAVLGAGFSVWVGVSRHYLGGGDFSQTGLSLNLSVYHKPEGASACSATMVWQHMELVPVAVTAPARAAMLAERGRQWLAVGISLSGQLPS